MLQQRDRTLIGSAGLILCAFAGIVTPRSAAAVAFTSSVASGAYATRTSAPTGRQVAIVRDPFVADVSSADSAGRKRNFGEPIAAIPGLPVLPPNRAVAGVAPGPDGTRVVVRAVIVGAHPAALVDVAGQSMLIKPGDQLAGRRVDAIDLGGVTLSGKMHLDLAQ
jgi:hypothetical protein